MRAVLLLGLVTGLLRPPRLVNAVKHEVRTPPPPKAGVTGATALHELHDPTLVNEQVHEKRELHIIPAATKKAAPAAAVTETVHMKPLPTGAPVPARDQEYGFCFGAVLAGIVFLGLSGAGWVPMEASILRVLLKAATQLVCAGVLGMLVLVFLLIFADRFRESMLHNGSSDDYTVLVERVGRSILFFQLAALVHFGALGAGRALWLSSWKTAENKDLESILDWYDHLDHLDHLKKKDGDGERPGFWQHRRVREQLVFHALHRAMIVRTWAKKVRGITPGFSFALYLRNSLDTVLADILGMSLLSAVMTLALVGATIPLWPFSFSPSGDVRHWCFAIFTWVLAGTVCGLVVHLKNVKRQLTAPLVLDSLRQEKVSCPPYLEGAPPCDGSTKHTQLFFMGPQFQLDILRAFLMLSVVLTTGAFVSFSEEVWQWYTVMVVLLPLTVLITYLMPTAIGLLTLTTSIELMVRPELIRTSQRASTKKAAYRTVLQHVKIRELQRCDPNALRSQLQMTYDHWPHERRQEAIEWCSLYAPGGTTRHKIGLLCATLGGDAATARTWFDHLAEGADFLDERSTGAALCAVERCEDPLESSAVKLFLPEDQQLDKNSLSHAFYKMGLEGLEPNHCAEILKSLPEPRTSVQLISWLQSLE